LSWPLISTAQGQKGDNPFGTAVVPVRYTLEISTYADAGNGDDTSAGDDQTPALADFTSMRTANANDVTDGDSAQITADYDTSFSLDTTTGILSGTFSGTISGSATNGSGFEESPSGEAEAFLYFSFEITSGSAILELSGNGSASGSSLPSLGGVSVRVSGDGGGTPVFQQFISGEGESNSGTISEMLTLGPGRYSLRIELSGEAYFEDDEDLGLATCASSVTVSVKITPEADVVFWEGLNGAFDDAENWEPQVVPDSGQTAIFDKAASYAVTIDTAVTNRVLVERGFVDFINGFYEVFGGNEDNASIVVGNTAVDLASLTLVNHTLVVGSGTLGADTDAKGSVSISAAGSSWNVQERLVIGNSGYGSLGLDAGATGTSGETSLGLEAGGLGEFAMDNIAPTAPDLPPLTWTAGPMNVGVKGTGRIWINGATMNSGPVTMAVEPGSTSNVKLGEQVTGQWSVNGDLVVGDQGNADVSILNGSYIGPDIQGEISIGNQAGSTGAILVKGGEASQSSMTCTILTVGKEGTGTLRIEGGGSAIAEEISVGSEESSEGTVEVTGQGTIFKSELSALEGLFVGSLSKGTVLVENGAELRTKIGQIGKYNGGDGMVTVDGAQWLNDESIWIGAVIEADGEIPAEIIGIGKLVLKNVGLVQSPVGITLDEGSTIEIDGCSTIETDNLWNNGGTILPGFCAAKQVGSSGGATIMGNYTQTAGTIEVEVGGTNPGEYAALEVTGDAELSGGAIEFIFVEDYLPQIGDTVPFLSVDGTASLSGVTFQYRGAPDGFEFQVNEESGALVFEALNDAQAEGMGEGEGEGEGSAEGEGEGEGESPSTGCAAGKVMGAPIGQPVRETLFMFMALGAILFLTSRRAFNQEGK
jgi:T5SS/PEP-CTERM-associated repeat protein